MTSRVSPKMGGLCLGTRSVFVEISSACAGKCVLMTWSSCSTSVSSRLRCHQRQTFTTMTFRSKECR